jgi:hypothetical protein
MATHMRHSHGHTYEAFALPQAHSDQACAITRQLSMFSFHQSLLHTHYTSCIRSDVPQPPTIQEIGQLQAHAGPVFSLRPCPSHLGTLLSGGGKDRSVHMWRLGKDLEGLIVWSCAVNELWCLCACLNRFTDSVGWLIQSVVLCAYVLCMHVCHQATVCMSYVHVTEHHELYTCD